jgi:hypothetical protein
MSKKRVWLRGRCWRGEFFYWPKYLSQKPSVLAITSPIKEGYKFMEMKVFSQKEKLSH